MVNYENFYPGAGYGLDPDPEVSYGGPIAPYVPVSQIGLATDARTANQLKATSEKISAGVQVVEIQGTMPNIGEAIPEQHFKELERLKKLTGVELTFHGPLVEPTGIGKEGWDESQRRQAEAQIWTAVSRAHKLEPEGNVIVTLHTSNGLPEPRTRVKTPDGEIITTNLAIIDERTGRFGAMPKPKEHYLFKEKPDVDRELDRLNEENWSTALSNLSIDVDRGELQRYLPAGYTIKDYQTLSEMYQDAKQNPEIFKRKVESMGHAGKEVEAQVDAVDHANVFVKDSYVRLQEVFNQAYEAAKRGKNQEVLQKLNDYRDEVEPTMSAYKKDHTKVVELNTAVEKGLRLLGNIKPPKVFRPLEEFAIDKSAETFSNVALKAYEKYGDTAPIISLENPPAGMGLARADEIRKLIEKTRDKFVEKAQDELGISEGKARQQAEKLIGVTWDVGHINMIRKYGYTEEDILKETKKVAPYIKHVHLSDNFGMEHTELPMGMGNVPTKKHMELISKYNDKVKKIIEAADWYQHFQTSPFPETLAAFGSPVSTMAIAPYWDQTRAMYGGYFPGYGTMLPEQHFSTYGAGFAGLPPELGGQMAGKQRLGGAPIE